MKKVEQSPGYRESIPIKGVGVSVYTIPTDFPESDGTIAWDHTCLVLVTVNAGGKEGIGYTYADPAAGTFIEKTLKPLLIGKLVPENFADTQHPH